MMDIKTVLGEPREVVLQKRKESQLRILEG